MDSTAHGSFAFWMYLFFCLLFFNAPPKPIYMLVAVIAGILPDFDSIYWKIRGNDLDNDFQHHLNYWTHWPISFTPLMGLALLSFIINFYFGFITALTIGIYSHFICDSACCGDGLMWLKIPWKKGNYSPFVNLFSSKTDGYHGNYWIIRWRKTLMFKIGNIGGISVVISLVFRMVYDGFSFYSLVIMGFFVLSFILFDFMPVDKKFEAEPPNGRYDDYRKNPDYIRWMEENRYVLNSSMKVKGKKGKKNSPKGIT